LDDPLTLSEKAATIRWQYSAKTDDGSVIERSFPFTLNVSDIKAPNLVHNVGLPY